MFTSTADSTSLPAARSNAGKPGLIKFFIQGEMFGYGAHNYLTQRHIVCITEEQFPIMLGECGFEMVSLEGVGSFDNLLQRLLLMPVWGLLRLIGARHCLADSLMVVARKIRTPNQAAGATVWQHSQ